MPSLPVKGFNPRARRGRDQQSRMGVAGVLCFNPRARRGRDFTETRGFMMVWLFQSTRPQGARRYREIYAEIPRKFQSTRPQGARLDKCRYSVAQYGVSIHAPAGGATLASNGPVIERQQCCWSRPPRARGLKPIAFGFTGVGVCRAPRGRVD